MPTPVTNLWTQTFPFFDFPHALVYAAGYLWIGNQSNTGSLIRVDPSSPTTWNNVTFPNDGQHGWVSDVLYIASKNKIYALMGTPNNPVGYTRVAEVDPATLAYSDVISTSTYNVEQGSFTCDGTYLYIASRMSNAVYKYRISDWVLVDTLLTGMNLAHCCRYDSLSGNIYVTSSDPANGTLSILSIAASTFTINQSRVINSDRILTDDLAITDNYIWVGSEATGKIIRILKTNFNTRTVISTGITARNFGVFYDGTEIFTGWEGDPGIFARINPTTLAVQTFQFPNANQSSPNEFLHVGTTGYFTHYHINGTLTAIGLAGTPTTPTALGFLDGLFLSDSIALSGTTPTGPFILDAIALQDNVRFSLTRGGASEDTLTISDSIRVDYLGLNDFSDTLTVDDSFGVWNTTYFDEIVLTDQVDILAELPALVEILLDISDSLELFDGLGGFGSSPEQWAFGDRIFLDDSQRVILNSTDNGYLRRYLNDVLGR